MSIEEISRIEQEAINEETQAAADQAQAQQAAPDRQQVVMSAGLAEEFAEFLDIAAQVAAQAMAVPTVRQRFNHQANVEIAQAAIKLCNKYGYDARAILIGEDSTIGAWLGLAVVIGIPGYGVYKDIKIAKAKEVQQEAAANDDTEKTSEAKASK